MKETNNVLLCSPTKSAFYCMKHLLFILYIPIILPLVCFSNDYPVSLTEIESMMYPEGGFTGMLAKDESYWNVVKHSDKFLQKSDITYTQIADKLAYILKLNDENLPKPSREERIDTCKLLDRNALIMLGDGVQDHIGWAIVKDNDPKSNIVWWVLHVQHRGFVHCPWAKSGIDELHSAETKEIESQKTSVGWLGNKYNDFKASSSVYVIRKSGGPHWIAVPWMAPHLLGDHHFTEGAVPYHMDPEKLVNTLFP